MSRLPQITTSLERKIQFFRVIHDDLTPWSVQWTSLFTALRAAPRSHREVEVDTGTVTRIKVRTIADPFHLVMTTVRKTGLPIIEHDSGRRQFLDLEPDAGLGEPTHVVVTNNIVIVEYNHYGPRASAFFRFLLRAASVAGVPMNDARLGQLIRGDIFSHISEKGSEVAVLDLMVPTDLIRVVKEADESLGASLEAVSSVGTAQNVEVVLRKSVTREDPRGLDLPPNLLVNLFQRLNPFRERCRVRATFKDVGDRQAMIDLLCDPVQVRMPFPMVNTRNRSVSEGLAFDVLSQAYHDNRAEVLSARPI